MDKYREAAVEVITAFKTDSQKTACDKYRNLLIEVGSIDAAGRMTEEDLVESAKFFLKAEPPIFRIM